MSEQEQVVITREEFEAWKDSKVTKAIYANLTHLKERDAEYVSSGGTITKDADVSTDFIVGRIQGLNAFLLLDVVEEQKEVSNYDH